jgi:hypothetical protein
VFISEREKMSKSGRRERGLMIAACAVAFATAVSSPSHVRASDAQVVRKIERYCTTSWRNAGIRPQEWEDCTQQALVELLDRLPTSDLSVAIEQPDSDARRELNRAVWRLVKRNRRQPKGVSFSDAYVQSRPTNGSQTSWDEMELAARDCLSLRQWQILEMTRAGWRVVEIAEELDATPDRISDEKYKAITKLRERLG